ncbi:MAG: hypothetical protein PHH54_00690 [Candidatus Nanoarchaeia archaeon]|nr:hypothetical protein [Candidatus Nanoarchaeia archaeon]MDD5740479.1 hypothetical protein [Candidatus Nanoarchaeia archaeon]
MENRARELREIVKRTNEEVNKANEKSDRARNELRDYERRCQHEYSKTIYDPIYTSAYTIPGDKPGTMGVDWRGPTYVSAKTEPRWKRTCTRCGLEQITTRAKDSITKIPDFGEGAGRW